MERSIAVKKVLVIRDPGLIRPHTVNEVSKQIL